MMNEQGPYFDLVVERIVEETPDAKSVVLRVPDELEETFRYRAGQFLTFGVTVDEHPLVRCYCCIIFTMISNKYFLATSEHVTRSL